MEKVDKKTGETTYYLQMDPTMNVVGVCITLRRNSYGINL